MLIKKTIILPVLCSVLLSTVNLKIEASSKWSGYAEGIFNTLGSQTYLDPETNIEKETDGNKYWIEAGLTYEKREKNFDVNLDGKIKVTDLAFLEFSVKEANIVNHYNGWDLSYGRLYVNWNDIDRSWQLGKVNNRVNFDFYDSEQEGLTGILLKSTKSHGFTWEVFGSGIYIPETNPSQDRDEEAGTITPKSAWASQIADSVVISGQQRSINYQVDMPEIADIVLQYSVGAKLGYRSGSFNMSGFILRKPENNITLGAGVNLDTTQNTIVANVEPRVFYHNVLGADISYRLQNNFVLKASALFVVPDAGPEDDFDFFSSITNIKSGKRDESYLGAGLAKSGANYRFALRYIARVSKFDRTDDILVENPRWNQAINLFTQVRLGQRLRLTFDGKYDTLAGDRVVYLDASYKVNNHLLLRAGVRFIGAEEDEISFWKPFVNNDAVYAGARILF